MPTYDYKCLVCNNSFEVFQKMSDENLKECPECGGNVKRLIGAGLSPIFKGNGFYQTDYKNSSPKSNSVDKNDTKETPSAKKEKPSTETKNNSTEKKAG